MSIRIKHSLQAIILHCCAIIGSLVPLFPVSAVTPVLPVDPAPLAIKAKSTPVAQARSAMLTALLKDVALYYLSELSILYAANDLQPMWQDRVAIQRFQQQLAELAMSGIQPQFVQWIKWLNNPKIRGLARDAVLSDAMLGYLHFVAGVATKGNVWLYSDAPYKMAIPTAEMLNRWQQAVQTDTTAAFLSTLAPQHPQYEKMHQALKKLLADKQLWPQFTNESTLRSGQLSNNIPALRNILSRSSMLPVTATTSVDSSAVMVLGDTSAVLVNDDLSADEEVNHVATVGKTTPPQAPVIEYLNSPVSIIDNRYSDDLVAAVKRFQQWQGLTPDGIIGARTRDWLNVSPQMRANLLALNIQRLRLLPGYIDSGIMVNIANYSLAYYKGGSEVLSSRVIVGRPSRKTPLMSSALNNVVVNPPWNVPTSLAKQDILPKARQDAGYFQRHGYTILSGWSNTDQVIDPSMIDWRVISANNFPYRLRQMPGASNSLGRYKFNMPTSDAIYLHDTPSHHLFKKDIRALSSGCVRVNKAADLANMLLQDAGWNDTRLSNTLKQGNTTYVNIRERIPVQLYYLTAWVTEDGKPHFRTDIYNYDKMVLSNRLTSSLVDVLLQ